MNIIVCDNKYTLFPFSINHASFEMKIGMFTNLDRIQMLCDDNDKIYLEVNPEIEEIIKEKYPKYTINTQSLPEGMKLIGSSPYKKLKQDFKDLSGWGDVLKLNKEFLFYDFEIYECTQNYIKHDSVILINNQFIKINNGSNLKAGVIIDAEDGPVVLGKNVLVDVGAIIKGPVFIDDNSYVAPGAKIRSGTSIGKNCKVGGEISNSIILDYSNKVHDGFLGHSFIGEWVNIGAGTNNSNLKNNYSTVKFNYGDSRGLVDTKEQFLGAFIGDYTKLGISTMLNAGTHIGIGANVFGGNFQDKYILPFSWGKDDKVDFNKFVETCRKMKLRRNIKISKIEVDFLKYIYDKIN
tara:strand:+ start:152 stop:1204 length:1053 start_codon:yes stop_codon:yes gene_type:complete